MKIKNINTNKKKLIIAEIGNNHEGSLKNAKKLIKLAKNAGANAVKFQTYTTKGLINKKNVKRFKQLQKFELSKSDFIKLKNYTKKLKLLFISTPFDIESAKFLVKICDALKIASSDNNYFELINQVCSSSKPVIISTGLLKYEEIINLYRKLINKHGNKIKKRLALLHCVSSYPANDEDLNLKFIQLLKKRIDCTIGYSDHSIGPLASILSVASGADIVEKHFTISKKFSKFRDHKLSADPAEMSFIVNNVNKVSKMLGNKEKTLKKNEIKNLKVARRSIFANKFIRINQIVGKNDIKIVRPGNGLEPNQVNEILGKISRKNIKEDSLINFKQFYKK